MSPAFDAAIQTTDPTVSIAARAAGSVQPNSTKATEAPTNVTSVIAEVGFEETPIKPTMRDDTTTKQTPKMATPSAATSRGPKAMLPASSPGTATRVTTTASGTTTTIHDGTSRSVRGVLSPSFMATPPRRRPRMTAANELAIVGRDLITATMPAAATAPAPM